MAISFSKCVGLRKDEDGATIIEFAIIAPIFFFMLLGTFEIGYAMYMKSALDGAIQQAARDATLQQGNDPADRRAIDDKLRSVLKAVNGSLKDENFIITRKSYFDFSNVERLEDYTDTNGNGTCDSNEEYEDENGNEKWGTVGRSDNGGARDAVLYTVTVGYDAVFPLDKFVRKGASEGSSFVLRGLPDVRTVTAQTLLKNQPFGDQPVRGTGGAKRNCITDADIDEEVDYEDDYDEDDVEA